MLRDLIGVPFDEMNCANLVINVFRRYGITLPDYEFNNIATSAAMALQREQRISDAIGAADWVRVSWEPTPPSLMVLRSSSGHVDHVGVYIGDGRFIHSDRRMGVIMNTVSDPRWKHRVAGYYEYTG